MSQSYTDTTVKDDIAPVELGMLCVVFVASALSVHVLETANTKTV